MQGATASITDEAQQQLMALLHSQPVYSNENVTALQKVIVRDDLGLKLDEKKNSVLESVDYNICQRTFDLVCEIALRS